MRRTGEVDAGIARLPQHVLGEAEPECHAADDAADGADRQRSWALQDSNLAGTTWNSFSARTPYCS